MAGINQTVQAAQGGPVTNKLPQPQSWAQKNPGYAMAATEGMAGLSGLLSGLLGGGGMFGRKEKTNQVPLFSPGVMGLKEQMPQNIMSQIMGNQFDFGPIENLARQNFSSQTLPSLMGRFNMGDNRASSNQFGAMSNAGQNLDAQLAAMRQQFGQQRQSLLSGLLPSLMTPSFENVMQPRQQGGMEQGMQAMMEMLPMLLKFL